MFRHDSADNAPSAGVQRFRSFYPFTAKLAFFGELIEITTAETGGESDWQVMAKSPSGRLINFDIVAVAVGPLARLATDPTDRPLHPDPQPL